MNKRLRKNIIEFIATSWPLDAAPRALEDVLYELATQNFNTPETAAAEFSEEDRNGALEELNSILVHTENEAIPCRFSFNENSNDHIQGSSFIQKSDNDATRRAKTRRLNYDAYHLFLKNLQWREFEACCRGVLEHLGCASPRLTAHSSDQGIDFFGRLSLRDRLGNQSILPSIDSMLDIWMVGQAKHYQKTKVSTPDLRELVGSVQLARAKAFADDGRALQGLDLRACDPVFYLFFTTGTITLDGYKLLKASGVVSMDGAQLAAFLADNDIGITDGDFDESAAKSWINIHDQ